VLLESKKKDLAELEALASQGSIDLFYGDETRVSSEGYVPYGWQFKDETVCVLSEKGYGMNILGLISRDNKCHFTSTEQTINAAFVLSYLDDLSRKITIETFIVLDNASIHKARLLQEKWAVWQERGLFIFFLPPYSPQLNLAETMWRKLKTEWLQASDYGEKERLFCAIDKYMNNIGNKNTIRFNPFNIN